ncbi:hypothetical protein N7530_003766 [Penicillium desertorum]|uniref:Uncharacterized protein n=1 Tax=Penicillium desertorum TaxID=1303715 RepID=A0A9W9WX33_9EURO|nr:hypothetical protein N7530_003766 [Penicillium desertorum]
MIEGSNKIANHPSNSSFNHSANAISIKDSVASNSNNNNKKDNKKTGNDKSKSGSNDNSNNNNKKDKKQQKQQYEYEKDIIWFAMPQPGQIIGQVNS